MENEERVEVAKRLKAQIDQTEPVTDWGFTCSVWTKPDSTGGLVRVYVNDKKRNPAAMLNVDADGAVTAQWFRGHSLTRDALRVAFGV